MPIVASAWDTIHPSVYSEAARAVGRATATPRLHGALRYRCPVTGGFVLLTEEAALANVARARGRTRCPGCGEMHLLTFDDGPDAPVCDPVQQNLSKSV